jgi:hypothetical protein
MILSLPSPTLTALTSTTTQLHHKGQPQLWRNAASLARPPASSVNGMQKQGAHPKGTPLSPSSISHFPSVGSNAPPRLHRDTLSTSTAAAPAIATPPTASTAAASCTAAAPSATWHAVAPAAWPALTALATTVAASRFALKVRALVGCHIVDANHNRSSGPSTHATYGNAGRS